MTYFISISNKPVGPYSYSQMEELISQAAVGPYDLVQVEGSEWKPLCEIPEFPQGIVPAVQKIGELNDWVILFKTSNLSNEGREFYEQKGPFANEEVRDLIVSGRVNFQTRAWAPGLKAWVKLSDRPEFRELFISLAPLDPSLV